MVDLSKIKPGDELTVRVRAYERRDTGYAIRSLTDERDTYVRAEHIVSHHPKALAVGDRVRVRGGSDLLRLVAIDGDAAWARLWNEPAGRRGAVWPLAELERADD